jgi:hypothetical protein
VQPPRTDAIAESDIKGRVRAKTQTRPQWDEAEKIRQRLDDGCIYPFAGQAWLANRDAALLDPLDWPVLTIGYSREWVVFGRRFTERDDRVSAV